MSSRRFSFLTVCFGSSVVLLHLILIFTIFNHFWHSRNSNDEILARRSKIKELLESKIRAGTLEVSSVASAFDRENGWSFFFRRRFDKSKDLTTMAPMSTTETTWMVEETEKVYKLAQDDDDTSFETKIDEPKITTDSNDVDSDEYKDLDDEAEDWQPILLTTPLMVSSTDSTDDYFTVSEEETQQTESSTTTTTTTTTTSPTTTSTFSTTTATTPSTTTTTSPSTTTLRTTPTTSFFVKNYEDYRRKLPSIPVNQDLLQRLQHEHRHRHHHHETPDTTLVTAILDIGRGHWHTYGRPLSRYHEYMAEILRLKVPFVVFTDQQSAEFVTSTRQQLGLASMTKTHLITLNDLPLARHLDVMKAIIHHELHGFGWQPNWDAAMRTHPEAKSAEYDLVVNSKPYFVFNASIDNPFQTRFFAWIDAGYGQGKRQYFPWNHRWKPHFPPKTISIAKVTPQFDDIRRYSLKDLYRQDRAVISGGFFGGDSEAVQRLYQKYNNKMIELLFRFRVVDDDQTIFVLIINDEPAFFNVLHADWFDAFKLFKK